MVKLVMFLNFPYNLIINIYLTQITAAPRKKDTATVKRSCGGNAVGAGVVE